MLNAIKKFPIIILSAPRTGSSALCQMLSEIYSFIPNMFAFDEPLPPSYRFEKFNEFQQKHDSYILKVQALEYKKIPLSIRDRIENKKTTVIILQRSDLLGQYTSHYIANMTGNWRFKYEWDYSNINNGYEVPVDLSIMKQSIDEIDFQNYSLMQLKNILPVDFILYMEDYHFEQQKLFPTIKPKNYETIKSMIDNIKQSNEEVL